MHENAAVFRDGPTLQNGVKLVKEIWPEIMRGIKVRIRPALDILFLSLCRPSLIIFCKNAVNFKICLSDVYANMFSSDIFLRKVTLINLSYQLSIGGKIL